MKNNFTILSILVTILLIVSCQSTSETNETKIPKNMTFNPQNIIISKSKIFLLSNKDIFDKFYDILKIQEHKISVSGSGSYIDDFKNSPQYRMMNSRFTIISYVKDNEEKDKLARIITYFYEDNLEKLTKKTNTATSIIYFQKRESGEPLLLIVTQNNENMGNIFEYLSTIEEINEGYTTLKHK